MVAVRKINYAYEVLKIIPVHFKYVDEICVVADATNEVIITPEGVLPIHHTTIAKYPRSINADSLTTGITLLYSWIAQIRYSGSILLLML